MNFTNISGGKAFQILAIGFLFSICPAIVSAQAPESNEPITSRDRVYQADQTSNTVSVIDPLENKLLGLIKLGDARPNVLSALYKGELNVHGLVFSPDHRTLAVISTGSNSVTLIDTATNKVKGIIYIGRSPHEGFFTPDGKELWVVVRGEDYISVIDPEKMRETRRIKTANGPGMVVFSPDGRRAFVCHSFTAELNVIDTRSYEVVKRIPVVSPFSPNLAITADGAEIWMTHKDVGKTTVIDARRMEVMHVLETGAVTNHVNFAQTAQGRLAYITIGGENVVKVYKHGNNGAPALVATIPTGALPHGIWASDNGSRIYVALENGDAVDVIDTAQQKVITQIKTGQMPQALVFVSNASPDASAANLVSLERAIENIQLKFNTPSAGKTTNKPAMKTAPTGFGVIRPLGLLDSLDVNFSNLEPETEYELILSGNDKNAQKNTTVLTVLKTDKNGKAVGQALSPLREILQSNITKAENKSRQIVLRRAAADNSRKIVLESMLNQ